MEDALTDASENAASLLGFGVTKRLRGHARTKAIYSDAIDRTGCGGPLSSQLEHNIRLIVYGQIFVLGALSENVFSPNGWQGKSHNKKIPNVWLLWVVRWFYPCPYEN